MGVFQRAVSFNSQMLRPVDAMIASAPVHAFPLTHQSLGFPV
jgi:hypothetical protein